MSLLFYIKESAQQANLANQNRIPVLYDGKVLPYQATKPVLLSGDTDTATEQTSYNGGQYPRDKKTYQPPQKDLTNNPSLLTIGNVTLPRDVAIYINGEKNLVMENILDGVSVIERIARRAYELEFECVVRTLSSDGINYVFAQDDLDNIWTNLWLPDSVQKIQNTYLNKLGIQEMVIQTVNPTTVRGSKNIPLRIRGYENVPGQTLIV